VSRTIVFLTDYGLADGFVGVCHGVMATIAPKARVIDLTHAVPAQDVLHGALVLERAAPFMPPASVFVAVVDPGVGSERRSIAVRTREGADLVGPDNGLLCLAWEVLGGVETAVEVTDPEAMLDPVSKTFHGRDVFAPVAAHLAVGVALLELGPSIAPDALATIESPVAMVTPGAVGARVTAVDRFGNVQLNVRPQDLERAGIGSTIAVGPWRLPRVSIFADVPVGTLAAIVDSDGFCSLVVNRGNASQQLDLREGATVVLESGDDRGPFNLPRA
jgi:hypothetical protein